MGKYKSLAEIKGMFEHVVDDEFINYSPNDSWVVIQSKLDAASGERVTESSLKMNLYSALRPIVEDGIHISSTSRLYEHCVSAGQGSSSVLDSCYLKTEESWVSCWIQYDGLFILGKDRNRISNSSSTVQSLALESILIITELARNNDREKLNEIKNYLTYFTD